MCAVLHYIALAVFDRLMIVDHVQVAVSVPTVSVDATVFNMLICFRLYIEG